MPALGYLTDIQANTGFNNALVPGLAAGHDKVFDFFVVQLE